MPPPRLPRARRGFGLIDLSLGIIAGIGALTGAVILLGQVNLNRDVSEVTRSVLSLSNEIRSASRSMMRVSELPGTDNGETRELNLQHYTLDTLIEQRARVFAPLFGVDEFTLEMRGLSERACLRALVNPASLGAGTVHTGCIADADGGPQDVLTVTFAR